MHNEVNLIGRVGNDPRIIPTKTGNEMATISVATSKNWKDKRTGEWNEKTEWHSVVGMGYSADAVKRVAKGDVVLVQGEITYSERDGVKYTNINARLVKRLSKSESNAKQTQNKSQSGGGFVDDMMSDDIPF